MFYTLKSLLLTPITINGVTFKRTNVSGDYGGMEGGAIATEHCTMRKNELFSLTTQLWYLKYKGEVFDTDKESEIFNQVLSTFKFIN